MADAPILGGSKQLKLDADVFGAPFNGPLVHECVVAELAARRRGTHATKTRGMVRGGGAKPWRQKGTGRARQGTIRAPQWTGGGVVFGPSPRHYTVKVIRSRCRIRPWPDEFNTRRASVTPTANCGKWCAPRSVTSSSAASSLRANRWPRRRWPPGSPSAEVRSGPR